jgi:Nickel responsive protein SCO4226-like
VVQSATRAIQRREAGMQKFIIEREIPEVGSLDRAQLKAAAVKSNEALAQLAPDIQWVESYVANDKTFCVYLARDEEVIRRHAEISGFPASKITPVKRTIDPTTAT